MTLTFHINLDSIFYLPDWVVHPTLVDPFLFPTTGAEQAGRAKGWSPAQALWAGFFKQRDFFERSEIEIRCPRCEAPVPTNHNNDKKYINNAYNNDFYNDKPPKSDNDNLTDGTEDANHNGRIDGDNGDGTYDESEIWSETSPNLVDSDGDTFDDDDEINWGYDPLSKDTDGDGLCDNVEDKSNFGTKDSTETSVTDSDTDGDGLSDKMEIDGWTVIIVLEATLEIDEEREVTSDPLISDFDGDGLNDGMEYRNGTDPKNSDTDDDGISDYLEIEGNYNSLAYGTDGTPPEIWYFECSYEENFWDMNPIKLLSGGLKLELKVGVKDIFGIEAINVDIRGLGDKISYGYGLDNITKTFDWSINSPDKYERVMFKGFKINISTTDINGNIGFNLEEVEDICDMIIDKLIGPMKKVATIILELLSDLNTYIYSKLSILNIYTIEFKDNLNNVKDAAIDFILFIYEYFVTTDSIVNDIYTQMVNVFRSYMDKIEIIIHQIINMLVRLLIKNEYLKEFIEVIIKELINSIHEVFNIMEENIRTGINEISDIEVSLKDAIKGINQSYFDPRKENFDATEGTKSEEEIMWWEVGLGTKYQGKYYPDKKASLIERNFPNRWVGDFNVILIFTLSLIAVITAGLSAYAIIQLNKALTQAAATAKLGGAGAIETAIDHHIFCILLIIVGLTFTLIGGLMGSDADVIEKKDLIGGFPLIYIKLFLEVFGFCGTVAGIALGITSPVSLGVDKIIYMCSGIGALIQLGVVIYTIGLLAITMNDDDDDGLVNWIERFGEWEIVIYEQNWVSNNRNALLLNPKRITISELNIKEADSDFDGIIDSDELYPGKFLGRKDIYDDYHPGYYLSDPTDPDTDDDLRPDGFGPTGPDKNQFVVTWFDEGSPVHYGESSHLLVDDNSPKCHPSITEDKDLLGEFYFVFPNN